MCVSVCTIFQKKVGVDGQMEVSPVVRHSKYHILLFSADSLLLPVVGLNKMGPERRKGRSVASRISNALFPGNTSFERNVTVAKSSQAMGVNIERAPTKDRIEELKQCRALKLLCLHQVNQNICCFLTQIFHSPKMSKKVGVLDCGPPFVRPWTA